MKKAQLRIIGGQWRGRKLHFPTVPGLRPSPNRIRETLFNWLAPYLSDAHCLDLFAGSGALGFEALSRQAKSVTFIEQSATLSRYLEQQIAQFAVADRAVVYQARFPFTPLAVLKGKSALFNLVFLDPPFHQGLIEKACYWLVKEQLIAAESIIYIETESTLKSLSLPANWQVEPCKIAGKVQYGLIKLNLKKHVLTL
jgi:16S rRNA (guanine966-N2)-methyltransferase